MKENNFEIQAKPLVSKMGAYMGINMEVMKDNSDSRIADMLIQGLTMGVLNVTKNIDKFNVGLSYGTDFMEISKNVDTKTFKASLGVNF